ncbi:DUF4017 family protein [Caryophanon latum]|uniref:DUF4017 domain-containing protein n=1 Tax=Caryophanon latum TaxID=33977 RepID=A0A1C0YPX8_9BACL|nr:DUF4017 family protein [Caryophanon latum]OCS89230.1 hypothetical protein A6K76_12835 [Caryophanon latum]
MKFIIPISVYVIICIIAVMLPASDGYDSFGWKLFVGQLYALPALAIAALLCLLFIKRKNS